MKDERNLTVSNLALMWMKLHGPQLPELTEDEFRAADQDPTEELSGAIGYLLRGWLARFLESRSTIVKEGSGDGY